MNKHTPGPWRIASVEYPVYWVGPDPEHFKLVAATMQGNDEANGRLLAAAPELLEALKLAVAHLDYCGYGDKWERECAVESGLAKRLEAAIAKAEAE